MKAGPLRATAVFIAVHLWTVAELVCALRGFVGVIFTYLLILLLFFDAGVVNVRDTNNTTTQEGNYIESKLRKIQERGAKKRKTYKAWGGDCVALLSLWYPDPLARAPFICSWRT